MQQATSADHQAAARFKEDTVNSSTSEQEEKARRLCAQVAWKRERAESAILNTQYWWHKYQQEHHTTGAIWLARNAATAGTSLPLRMGSGKCFQGNLDPYGLTGGAEGVLAGGVGLLRLVATLFLCGVRFTAYCEGSMPGGSLC